MKLKYELSIPIIVFLILGFLFFNIFILNLLNNYYKKSVEDFRNEEVSNYKLKLKELVDNAYSVLTYNYEKFQNAVLDENSAKENAKNQIRKMRYGTEGYYWIDNKNYILQVLPPSPSSEGMNRENLQDVNGKKMVKEFIDGAVKDGEVYVEYWFRKLGDETPSPKLSYTRYFKEWEWIIGTGFYIDEIEKIVLLKEKELKKQIKSIIFASFLFTIFIMIFISFIISKILNKTVKDINTLNDVSRKFADGDLRETVSIKSKNEIGELANNFNNLIIKIKDIILNIQDQGEIIGTSVKEINKANENLAIKASTQASSLEETSSSMTRISEVVKSNLLKIENTNKLSNEIKDKSKEIGNLSNSLKNSIENIENSSNQIKNIIEIINSMTLQTNLLSINASIEATKAGNFGKGFAVVSNEIRNLANKSTVSSKEIKEIVKENFSIVGEGKFLINDTIEKLNQVISMIEDISLEINEINSSSILEKTSIFEINSAINQLDEITQTNAGIAEETSASTQILYEKSKEFLELIKFFKLN